MNVKGSCALMLISATTHLGCGGASKFEALRSRAAFDLSCDAQSLQVSTLQKFHGCLLSEEDCTSVAGVQGCERKATYVFAPNGTWVMNTDTERTGTDKGTAELKEAEKE